ncbi:hypothetical protein QFZ75_000160 [Streptomyces sp. V3I8]|uniref:hypothetical protein n=1 Tax=Streptomyces sp. V3I8 TaxID=3042279 RepID=UPI00277F8B14|nr:hypothetical protein [Streptomyces sp. V3I8]MDQ1033744.1 hypothetical protein [Streptomyces sp. V3I8]
MTQEQPRPRPFRIAGSRAATTGSALAVVLIPLVVGALASRAAGGDPMASVNALMTGGGQRARLSRSQLRTCRGRALTTARHVWDRSAGRTDRKPLRPAAFAGVGRRTGRERPAAPRPEARSTAGRP